MAVETRLTRIIILTYWRIQVIYLKEVNGDRIPHP